MSESETKTKPKFDLSDGIGKEDFLAIVYGIWHSFVMLLKIIFWPWIWALREIGRTMRFMKSGHDNLLNDSERQFLESLPLFFTVIGLLGGFAVGLIAIFTLTDFVVEIFEDFDLVKVLEDLAGGISEIVVGFWDAFVTIAEAVVDFFEGVLKFFGDDPFFALIGLSIIGLSLVILYFVISETGVVQRFFARIGSTWGFFKNFPNRLWNKLNGWYLGFNHRFAGLVLGRQRLDNNTQRFFRKVLIATILLGLYTFLGGIVILANYFKDESELAQLVYLSFTLFMLGVVTGVIELFFLTRVLDMVSRSRYLTEDVEAKAS
ncbi:MAG: hypothetical protein ACE5OZ_02045 [Candidatus Heimdallarchaeota archaeon]